MFHEKLRTLRQARNMSQVELAKRLGVTKQSVSNWENDNIQPSIEMLVRIAAVFAVSADYLLGIDAARAIDVSGLPEEVIAHLSQLVEDFRQSLGRHPRNLMAEIEPRVRTGDIDEKMV